MTNRNDLVERLEFLAKTACLPPDSLEAIREAADALRSAMPQGEAVAQEPIAVLRREIGEDTWFDWTPVKPGSKAHLLLQESGEMDYTAWCTPTPPPLPLPPRLRGCR